MFVFRLIYMLLISSVVLPSANAFEQMKFAIEQAEFSGWQVENLALDFDISAEEIPQLFISINKLKSATGETFKEISIVCPFPSLQHVLQINLIQCKSGSFSVKHKQFGRLKGDLDFVFDAENERIETSIRNMQIAKGRIGLTATVRKGKWQFDLKGRSLDVAHLKKLAAAFVTLPDATSDESGEINLDLTVNGSDAAVKSANIKLRTFDLGFDGNSVAEELDATLNVSVQKHGAEWRVKEDLSLIDGVVYIESGIQLGAVSPGFLLEPGEEPITLSLDADMRAERIKVHEMVLTHPQVMTARVSGVMHPQQDAPIDDLTLSFNTDDLKSVFPVYIQPLLYGTGLDEMEIVGQTYLKIKLGENGITDFHLIVGDVYADDLAGRFHIAGLDGDVRLNSDPNVKDSAMQWQGGSIYKMNIGPSEMKLSSKGRSMKLREKMLIPIFDGQLEVDDIEMKNLGLQDYSVHIESKLTPITLSEFTEATGWPIMAGSISGEIPGVTYHQGNLTTEGRLRVSVFDGDITISKLRIDNLFDLIPTLYADISVDVLDLGTLTETFEFGDITGKLSGYMHELRLDNWQPVQFNAHFSTPEGDRSRRRISQRAIDNLTSIGGGGGANAISRGILGMFKDFPYSKIGLSCQLADSICYMNGVEETEDGYYIVKQGFFPPWLNIKGFNRKVNWQEMLERLKNISKAENPIVE